MYGARDQWWALFPIRCIPQVDGAIRCTGREQRTIGTEPNVLYREVSLTRTRRRLEQLLSHASRDVPDLDLPIECPNGQESSVWAECETLSPQARGESCHLARVSRVPEQRTAVLRDGEKAAARVERHGPTQHARWPVCRHSLRPAIAEIQDLGRTISQYHRQRVTVRRHRQIARRLIDYKFVWRGALVVKDANHVIRAISRPGSGA